MKKLIVNFPLRVPALAKQLKVMAAATRVVQDRALFLEVAQQLEHKDKCVEVLQQLNQLFTEKFPGESLFHGGLGHGPHPAVKAMRELL